MSDSELLQVLKEILKWVRFSGLENVRLELTRSLDTDPKRLIYHLSDGTLTSQEIALKAKVSDFTVRNYWSQWYRRGIVEPLGVRGGTRYKKLFDLEDFSLLVPEISKKVDVIQQKNEDSSQDKVKI